ncbi:hypothetical protein [Phenylobacterium sp.]|uniref:hypothetical protein n=1 Tax=Phenylobacterium sp. TaxID=1871053 RepID=UPI0012092FF9|nr:hypothetical protein [Phenylobacterium sp.]THD57480.1 MAG: hypothetical protein E8A49_22835 [Phenylobacterium sp.]
MCLAAILALVLLPLGGWAIGYSQGGAMAGGIGAGVGLAAAAILAGVPTAIFFGAEKKKYDRESEEEDE